MSDRSRPRVRVEEIDLSKRQCSKGIGYIITAPKGPIITGAKNERTDSRK